MTSKSTLTDLYGNIEQKEDLFAANPLVGNPPVNPAVIERIRAVRDRLGSRVVILGHHYQRDEVIQFADRSGDSLDLALFASTQEEAEFIVFCGVHFMAETADILSKPNQVVLLPDMRAGCSMADMAAIDQVEECWDELSAATDSRILPITYINSAADLKGFVGRHDGAVCTSSNAEKILRWAFDQGPKVLFFPDQHLGRNTAYAMGIPLEDMVVYDPHSPGGGNEPEEYDRARVILWKGHCSVHQNFLPTNPPFWRQKMPGIQIIVHPECRFDVVQQSDVVGSTKKIVQTIENAPPGSQWAVGTEHHLVNRLRTRFPDKFITSLAPFACQCSTMFRISPEALAETLEAIEEGKVVSEKAAETDHWWRVIRVDEETARWSRIALERMLQMR
jgi:quinolinate synthase